MVQGRPGGAASARDWGSQGASEIRSLAGHMGARAILLLLIW